MKLSVCTGLDNCRRVALGADRGQLSALILGGQLLSRSCPTGHDKSMTATSAAPGEQDATTTTRTGTGPIGRLLVGVGAVPMWIEPHLPSVVRRNFGLRIFILAFVSIVVAPGTALVLFDELLPGALFISLVVASTGFLGYCEMYRALREINTRVKRIDDGEFEISFGTDRVDEIGETYTALEETARSLGETIDRAAAAKEDAERARQEAESARETAEQEREQAEQLSSHLEERAAAFSATMRAAADGDLTQRMADDGESEAMSEIATAFNAMMDDIETAMDEIGTFAHEVAATSDEVESDAARVEAVSEDVSDAIEEIAAGANEQRDLLEDVSTEMTQLSATVEEVASSARTVAETAQETADVATEGQRTAERAIDSAREVREVVETTVDNVEALDEQMTEIGEIVGLIGDIAEQTNMLALNANIEAARAGTGDGGDGFAVVADEVKQLAAETRDSAGKIDDLIEQTQGQTHETVEEVRTAQRHVDESVDAVQDAADAFARVAENAGETDSGIQEISDATDDQAGSAEQAASTVDRVADISRTTAEEAETVSGSAREQSSSIAQVSADVASLSDRAEQLQSLLDAFETAGSARPDRERTGPSGGGTGAGEALQGE
jgi:methyl-accepting chemotaxis protein